MGAVTIASLLVFYFSNNYFINQLVLLGQDLNLPSDHIFFRFVSRQENNINNIFVYAGSTILLIQSIFAILLSHKIAGPLYRFTKELNSIDKNESLKELKHRESDFFPEVYSAYNHVVKTRENNSLERKDVA